MSNDLLFSVLPREGAVKVFTDHRVQPVRKPPAHEAIGEDERDEHAPVRHESSEAQYTRHHVQKISDESPQQRKDAHEHNDTSKSEQNPPSDEQQESDATPSSSIYHHLDIFI